MLQVWSGQPEVQKSSYTNLHLASWKGRSECACPDIYCQPLLQALLTFSCNQCTVSICYVHDVLIWMFGGLWVQFDLFILIESNCLRAFCQQIQVINMCRYLTSGFLHDSFIKISIVLSQKGTRTLNNTWLSIGACNETLNIILIQFDLFEFLCIYVVFSYWHVYGVFDGKHINVNV